MTPRIISKKEHAEAETQARLAALKELDPTETFGGSSGFITETTAAKLLGVSRASLKKLALPCKEIPNPHYRSGSKSRLYDPRDILRSRDDERIAKAKVRSAGAKDRSNAKRVLREAKESIRDQQLKDGYIAQYGSWKRALPDACLYMYQLNHIANEEGCGCDPTDDKSKLCLRCSLFKLKSWMIRVLYEHGYCTEAWSCTRQSGHKVCYDCDGGGCERCNFTGHYRQSRTLKFFSFVFDVGDDRMYSWMQPDTEVDFKVEFTRPAEVMEPRDPEGDRDRARDRDYGGKTIETDEEITLTKHFVDWVFWERYDASSN